MMALTCRRKQSARHAPLAKIPLPGTLLHVVQRGNNRAPVFTGPDDYRFYLHCLRDAASLHGVAIHAYVLMTNHVHLLVSPASPHAPPTTMQTLGRRYVGQFNFLYRRTGTLWEGRYKGALVDSESFLLTCVRCVELNPVRARKVAYPGDYRWSSFRANGIDEPDSLVSPHPVHSSLGESASERRTAYRELLLIEDSQDALTTIGDATQCEWALGILAFRARVLAQTGCRGERCPLGRPPSDGAEETRF